MINTNDVEGGSVQSMSRNERLGEQGRLRGLRLHGVRLELRSKENEKSARTGRGTHEDNYEMRGRGRDSRIGN
jgi:hypothetical protein